MADIAIVYCGSTGSTYKLAQAAAAGAAGAGAGAEVRLLKVTELALDSAIDGNPAWRANVDATAEVPVATPDDLEWAAARHQGMRIVRFAKGLAQGRDQLVI